MSLHEDTIDDIENHLEMMGSGSEDSTESLVESNDIPTPNIRATSTPIIPGLPNSIYLAQAIIQGDYEDVPYDPIKNIFDYVQYHGRLLHVVRLLSQGQSSEPIGVLQSVLHIIGRKRGEYIQYTIKKKQPNPYLKTQHSSQHWISRGHVGNIDPSGSKLVYRGIPLSNELYDTIEYIPTYHDVGLYCYPAGVPPVNTTDHRLEPEDHQFDLEGDQLEPEDHQLESEDHQTLASNTTTDKPIRRTIARQAQLFPAGHALSGNSMFSSFSSDPSPPAFHSANPPNMNNTIPRPLITTTMSEISPSTNIVDFPKLSTKKTFQITRFYIMQCPVLSCNQQFDSIQGCFVHLNKNNKQHFNELGMVEKARDHATAVEVAGIQVIDATMQKVKDHNAHRNAVAVNAAAKDAQKTSEAMLQAKAAEDAEKARTNSEAGVQDSADAESGDFPEMDIDMDMDMDF